jgi:hypothetical protein
MNVGGAVAGGGVAALLSAAVWVGIGYLTGYQLGILALGVGLACGIGVAMGTRGHAGTAGGMIAAVWAVVAIVGARFVVLQLEINDMIREAGASVGEIPGPENSEYWIAFIADRIIDERFEAGAMDWEVPDEYYEDDDLANDYPSTVWAEAYQTWSDMSFSDRMEFCAAGRESILTGSAEDAESFRGIASIVGVLWTNLHPMALVIMALAVGTAFKVARDSHPVGEVEPGGALGFEQTAPTGLPGMPRANPVTGGPPTGLAAIPPPGSERAPGGLPGMPPPAPTGTKKYFSGELGS